MHTIIDTKTGDFRMVDIDIGNKGVWSSSSLGTKKGQSYLRSINIHDELNINMEEYK